MKNQAILLVLALLTVSVSAYAADKLRVYEGPWSEVKESDLAVHPLEDESYTESWFFMVQAENDLWLFIHYGISNLQPMSDFDGAMETTVIRKGEVTFVKDNISEDDVKYKKGKLDLTVGKNTLKKKGNGYALHVDQDGIKLDLTVTPQVEGVAPSKTVYPDNEFYALHIAAPRAKVSGNLVLDGDKIAVNGRGYFDHSLQNFPAHKMADRLYSFRGYSDAGGVNFLSFTVPEDLGGVDMPALVLMKEGKVVAKTASVKMKGTKMVSDGDNDYSYPTEWSFEAKDGDKPIKGTVRLAKRMQIQNAADDFNFFERTLIKTFVANPLLYRHPGSFEFSVGATTEPTVIKGDGVAEVMILRQD